MSPLNSSRNKSTIKIISANIRGFRTNIGEFTHNFVLKESADIVFVSETFLDDSFFATFGLIPGYSVWHRKDRNQDGGGVALCCKSGTRLQILEEVIPENLESIIFLFYDASGIPTLGFGVYRPPSQGLSALNYIHDKCDAIMAKYKVNHVIVFGDLNPRNIQPHFNNFVHIMNFENHGNFSTHVAGGMLDPVLSDLGSDHIMCLLDIPAPFSCFENVLSERHSLQQDPLLSAFSFIGRRSFLRLA